MHRLDEGSGIGRLFDLLSVGRQGTFASRSEREDLPGTEDTVWIDSFLYLAHHVDGRLTDRSFKELQLG